MLDTITERILYEDNDVAVGWAPISDSAQTVVTFSPRLGAPNLGHAQVRGSFGYDFFRKEGISAFHVIPKWNHWWQCSSMVAALEVIRQHRVAGQMLWTYGASMGGNGALMFAERLCADGVLSLYPQASVSFALAGFDPRWTEDRKRITSFDDSWLDGALPERTWIFFDPRFDLDRRHGDIIAARYRRIRIVPVRFSGHAGMRMLQECGVLSSTIREVLTDAFDPNALRGVLRETRGKSPVALTEASNELARLGKHECATAFSGAAIELLNETKQSGKQLDNATATLTVMAHASNLVRSRDAVGARRFLETLRTAPLANHDFTWHQVQLALLVQDGAEVLRLLEATLKAGRMTAAWFEVLVGALNGKVLTPAQIAQLHERWGAQLLTGPQSERYARAIANFDVAAKESLRSASRPSLIVGPSHAVRWAHHARDGVVRCGLSADRIIGLAGAPIWSKKLFDSAGALTGPDDQLAVIVGDFFYGNAVCLVEDAASGPLMRDGFLAIDARAITYDNNVKMLKRGMDALQVWHRQFGKRVRYIFWCLLGRQVHDRLAGHHIGDAGYHHPNFNYAEVVASLPEFDIVDLSPLLQQPMHEVSRLFIDSNSHASQIGYLTLDGLLCDGLSAPDAFRRAVENVESQLFALARQIAAAKGRKVFLTGRSVWLDTLMRYMGAAGLVRLAEAGLILSPLDRAPGQSSIAQITEGVRPTDCQLVVISSGGADLAPLLAQVFGADPRVWDGVPHIDWEGATKDVIAARGGKPRFTHDAAQKPQAPEVVSPTLEAHMVEQGPLGIPSWTGLRHVLELIGSGLAPAQKPDQPAAGQTFTPPAVHRIEGDALVTENGVAFLIGGNHSVLKYATGELAPTPASLDAFSANIAARRELARREKISYAHVIFPDKQSVMSDAFPFQPVRRLGDLYMSHLDPVLRPHVLYPADRLKAEPLAPFLSLDTHMTDHGSLAVLRMMLDATGIEAGAALARIRSRIVKPLRWPGDLGSKFTPHLYQDGLLLEPDWAVAEFRSAGGFNDGMIDILLSPDASLDRTALLFGDSFFRMMLKHLSAVFTRVVCLRTRFLHSEMVTLIRPDVIFTGNAERYLSNVSSDTEAHAFALYPYLRGSTGMEMNEDFFQAWDAVTSPRSSRAHEFMKRHGIVA